MSQELFKKYTPGHYYTIDGEKITGLLKFNYTPTPYQPKPYGTSSITFKENKKAKKVKLTTKEIVSFVIGQDTFTTAKDLHFHHVFNFKVTQDFVQVISSGKINLYHYYASVGTGSPNESAKATYPFLFKENMPVHVRYKERKEIILKLIADFPQLYEELKNSENKSIDLKDVIDRYNQNWL
ncbi:hypothetical protein [Sphingobacterium haloxyli]|uniref:Uncharacterized protein n=1 Tax=Sphingobacterium haloxyli TaxID=2100533 RepID=A0A2S9J6Y0_9SPHI|nr:hypothetical protein [Sphingobacterium haloxyli]PRD48507.1 hypothetical protein C5745_04715 [Sphingobacterium haloxyli]